jgi:hypothetical protein
MFMVGGGILLHGIPAASEWVHMIEVTVHNMPVVGSFLALFVYSLAGALMGVIAGGLVLGAVMLGSRLFSK